LNAYEWAIKNNYIDEKNVIISYKDFAQKVSQRFQTPFHSDWKVKGPSKQGYYMIIDSKRKKIFDYVSIRNITYYVFKNIK